MHVQDPRMHFGNHIVIGWWGAVTSTTSYKHILTCQKWEIGDVAAITPLCSQETV